MAAPGPIVPVALLVASGLCASRSEARRMIQQGAVAIDHQRVTDPMTPVPVAPGMIVRVGNRRFRQIQALAGAARRPPDAA